MIDYFNTSEISRDGLLNFHYIHEEDKIVYKKINIVDAIGFNKNWIYIGLDFNTTIVESKMKVVEGKINNKKVKTDVCLEVVKIKKDGNFIKGRDKANIEEKEDVYIREEDTTIEINLKVVFMESADISSVLNMFYTTDILFGTEKR